MKRITLKDTKGYLHGLDLDNYKEFVAKPVYSSPIADMVAGTKTTLMGYELTLVEFQFDHLVPENYKVLNVEVETYHKFKDFWTRAWD